MLPHPISGIYSDTFLYVFERKLASSSSHKQIEKIHVGIGTQHESLNASSLIRICYNINSEHSEKTLADFIVKSLLLHFLVNQLRIHFFSSHPLYHSMTPPLAFHMTKHKREMFFYLLFIVPLVFLHTEIGRNPKLGPDDP